MRSYRRPVRSTGRRVAASSASGIAVWRRPMSTSASRASTDRSNGRTCRLPTAAVPGARPASTTSMAGFTAPATRMPRACSTPGRMLRRGVRREARTCGDGRFGRVRQRVDLRSNIRAARLRGRGAGARGLEPGTCWPTCRRRATKSRRALGSDIDSKCESVTAVASQRPAFR